MATPSAPPPAQGDGDQDKWLDDAAENVRKQAFFMKRSLDNGDIREALKCATTMTSELRTANLSPKNYYELYMDVTNELRVLESTFEEEDRNGRSIVELYETVQHVSNIVPRLYLLVTVAATYIKSKKAPAKDILFDLLELARGVQNPMRGLFLRYYLSQMAKDKLPDVGSEYEHVGGTLNDAIEFVLQNFGEMNKLWVRMQHQGAVRDRSKREKERQNLKQLVGANLVRLSEMEGVDLAMYEQTVLPRVLEQVVNCKDKIAQEYLMEVVIQVFPDEFHLKTLETFLGTCSQLQKNVNVKSIIIALMNRLANFAKESPEGLTGQMEMFPLFLKYSSEVIEGNPKIALGDVLQLQVALINFASSVYSEHIEYIDHVLGFTVSRLSKGTGESPMDAACTKSLTQGLTLPLESLDLRILQLDHYASVMTFLDFDTRKSVAVSIMEAMLAAGRPLDTVEKVDKLFEIISPILKDQEDSRPREEGDSFEFDNEQVLAARLFHLISHPDTDTHFQLYAVARKHYGQGGTRRIRYSLPPLVFGSLQLAERIHKREEAKDEEKAPTVKAKKVFGFVIEIIGVLPAEYPELALRLFLDAAQVADRVHFEAIAYEFLAQAFIVYEDEVSDSKAQFTAINLICATLQSTKNFGEENFDTLVAKCTQHSAKLLKKPDQCRAVMLCSHLFWAGTDEHPVHRDERRVLECLQRSLKIANGCMGSQVHLFVEILNTYLYFFERNCPSISVKYLKGLIALIDEHIPNLDNSETSQIAKQQYDNTVRHIKMKQSMDTPAAARYRAISEDAE